MVSLFSLLNVRENVVLAQKIWVRCQAQDYQSSHFLTASWQWADSTGQVIARQTASRSGFSGIVSKQTRYLTVRSNGYRPMRLPVHWPQLPTDSASFRFVVPLVPIDKPTVNQPYFQSEQRPLQLEATADGNGPIPVKFSICDALTNQPVKAHLCLFFTSSHTQRCYDISTLTTELVQPDIVAIEARAPGYQSYLGNVITRNPVSRSALSYKIRLNPIPTILVVTRLDRNADTPLKITHTTMSYAMIAVDSSHFYSMASPGSYRLNGNTSTTQTSLDTLNLREGLNAYVIPPTRTRADQRQETVIYFSQSSHELSDSSKRKLERIAGYMIQNSYLKLEIIGHTDNVGHPQINVTLSEFRAKVTKGYLQHLGVPSGRISLHAAGPDQPSIDNDTEEHRGKNRRATLLLH